MAQLIDLSGPFTGGLSTSKLCNCSVHHVQVVPACQWVYCNCSSALLLHVTEGDGSVNKI